MGKKKLTEKQKKQIIEQKKKKQQEYKNIVQQLQKENQQSQSLIQDLESVKNIHKDKKLKHKQHQQEKAKKRNISKQDQDAIEEEIEEEEEVEQQPSKQIKTEQEQPVINIFQQSNFVNENFEEVKEGNTKSSKENYREAHIELENQAKLAFPDLNFNAYEGSKSVKQIQGELEQDRKADNKEIKKEEIEYSDHEDIVDEELKKLAKFYKKQNVKVQRSEEIQKIRGKLPVYFKEQEIVETINNNLVTIVCGQTGSGKSTQIPQFLYEAGYGNAGGQNPGMIGITQPRRLAAVSLAQRVAEELGGDIGDQVCYQIRHEASNFSEKSKIKFMTDGILMNEMASDFFLTKYSVIIIDEAHERKINTDLLLGLLTRLVNIRLRLATEQKGKFFPLRVVIMSATLRIEDFTKNKQLLPNAVNVINIEARTYPINLYFNKATNPNYLEEAVKKCTQIHKKLPPGDVLIFLTGEREIKEFVIMLNSELEKMKRKERKERYLKDKDFDLVDSDLEEEEQEENEGKDKEKEKEETKIISHNPLESENPNQEEKIKIEFQDFKVLPLYSKLSMEEQQKIFVKRENTRMFVVSTNVAETSLTIPNIKYVVDTGKEKKKIYSDKLCISKHVVAWTSQASCGQRSGRAGRTCPGYCYRLYTPAVFGNIMEKFSEPEIMNTPLENVILHLKNIGIKDILQFPFPTRPETRNLQISLQNLVKVQALKFPKQKDEDKMKEEINKFFQDEIKEDTTVITELGKVLSYIPLNPRYSKMLLQGKKADMLGYSLLIVSFLSIEEIYNKEAFKPERKTMDIEDDFLDDVGQDQDEEGSHQTNIKEKLRMLQKVKEKQKEIQEIKRQEIAAFKEKFDGFFQGKSDVFVAMNVLGEFVSYITKQDKYEMDKCIYDYAKENGLLSKALKEIYFNLNQLIEIIDYLVEDKKETDVQVKQFLENYKKPTTQQLSLLSEMVLGCFIDKVARKITYKDEKEMQRIAYECTETQEKVHINPKSFLSKNKPDYISYTNITESKKKFMNNITEIQELQWLQKYDYYNYRPCVYLDDPRPQYNKGLDRLQVKIEYVFGKDQWSIPPFWGSYAEESYAKYCHIGRELMDGNIVGVFKAFKKYSKLQPQSIKATSSTPEIKSLVSQLKHHQLDDRQKLLKKWKENPNFLKKQIFHWIKPEFAETLQKKWPPEF